MRLLASYCLLAANDGVVGPLLFGIFAIGVVFLIFHSMSDQRKSEEEKTRADKEKTRANNLKDRFESQDKGVPIGSLIEPASSSISYVLEAISSYSSSVSPADQMDLPIELDWLRYADPSKIEEDSQLVRETRVATKLATELKHWETVACICSAPVDLVLPIVCRYRQGEIPDEETMTVNLKECRRHLEAELPRLRSYCEPLIKNQQRLFYMKQVEATDALGFSWDARTSFPEFLGRARLKRPMLAFATALDRVRQEMRVEANEQLAARNSEYESRRLEYQRQLEEQYEQHRDELESEFDQKIATIQKEIHVQYTENFNVNKLRLEAKRERERRLQEISNDVHQKAMHHHVPTSEDELNAAIQKTFRRYLESHPEIDLPEPDDDWLANLENFSGVIRTEPPTQETRA
ncbi:Sec-independent protein translocase protein TatA [Rhodopirellula rubra]|uniref:Sec-independent protein translocase protein TatA n=1 Tax=Aporhodopirellula rubra TaxID=980271 RepID=A0A7W5E2K6_9BACT|nr:hypothetical protein [Aporhodopirellula rubra]MBB3209066.1 Sec-independent protein translocase protein TatA [Aporhodopirellula rubra]